VSTPRAGRASARTPAEISFMEDLATVLTGDRAVYLKLGPEGAVMSLTLDERKFAFGEAIEVRWRGMTPEERTQAVLSWIRKAAKYCRKPRIRWVPA